MFDEDCRLLLGAMVEMVRSRIDMHSGAAETCKRRAADAREQGNRAATIAMMNERERHIIAETEFANLANDMRAAIHAAYVKESS